MTRLVFRAPGFFGFSTIGSLSYFHDVEEALSRALRRRRIDARIVRCPTQPTGSIVRRADNLRRQVIARGGLKAAELHFVGPSTGGLDVRMLFTPEAFESLWDSVSMAIAGRSGTPRRRAST